MGDTHYGLRQSNKHSFPLILVLPKHRVHPMIINSQVKMIADAAPITAKKDEYTGDSEDIANST